MTRTMVASIALVALIVAAWLLVLPAPVCQGPGDGPVCAVWWDATHR